MTDEIPSTVSIDKFSEKEQAIINLFHRHIGYVEWADLEDFILVNSHIARPVIGHCFETWFDKLIQKLGYETQIIGGDDAVDRMINGKTLQLKTPYNNGTKEGVRVAYCLHKTHGLERRPGNLYKPENFADFLVGKVTNKKLLICSKEEIPKNKNYPNRQWGEYLADPVYFEWNNKWINRFDLLGIKINGELPDISAGESNILFPKLGKITQLSDLEIISTLLKRENFRVLEQNLKGSIRQYHFFAKAKELGIKLEEPSKEMLTRTRIKVDFIGPNEKRIQVKGRTKKLCKEYIVGVEVKGSHGRIPQRLYKRSDFDFLAVTLDPECIPIDIKEIDRNKYNFVIFPVESLPIHENSRKKVYSWTMKFKNGATKTLYSNNPAKGKLDEEKTKEWNDDYLKDIFFFDLRRVKINDLDLISP